MEAAAQAAGVAAEGAVRGEEAVRELLELLGRVHPDAGVEALGENDAVSESRTEPGGNREAVLGVEAVLVLAAERQLRRAFPSVVLPGREKELGRGGEVGGASPLRPLVNASDTVTHADPLRNTTVVGDWTRSVGRNCYPGAGIARSGLGSGFRPLVGRRGGPPSNALSCNPLCSSTQR